MASQTTPTTTPMIRNLSILLGVQLLLVAFVALGGGGDGGGRDAGPLLAFEAEAVDRLRIEDGDGTRIELARTAEGWALPAAGGFPADGARIDELLERLGALEAGAPVARSAQARERFRVTDADFERHLVLEADGDRVGELWLGRSRDTRLVHARAGDTDAVVVVDLPAWELPTARREWIDQGQLQIDRDEVVAVEVDGARVERIAAEEDAETDAETDGETDAEVADDDAAAEASAAWRAVTGEEFDEGAVDDLLRRLATLRVEDVLTDATEDSAAGTREIVLETRAGARLSYRFAAPETEGDRWGLKTSQRPERFRVGATAAEAIVEAADALTRRDATEEAGV